MEFAHLVAFLVLMPVVALSVALGTALAVTLFIFVFGYVSERKWRSAAFSYFWFSVLSVAVALIVNAVVTHRVTLIPQILQ